MKEVNQSSNFGNLSYSSLKNLTSEKGKRNWCVRNSTLWQVQSKCYQNTKGCTLRKIRTCRVERPFRLNGQCQKERRKRNKKRRRKLDSILLWQSDNQDDDYSYINGRRRKSRLIRPVFWETTKKIFVIEVKHRVTGPPKGNDVITVWTQWTDKIGPSKNLDKRGRTEKIKNIC